MGTITNPRHDPGHVTYESNVMSTYNVLEAAEELGLEAVSIASSVNAHGWSFQAAPPEIEYLPIDEEHAVSPRDPYGLAKRVLEVTAEGVARRDTSPDRIATLRISSAHTDEDLAEMAAKDPTLEDLREQYEPGDNPTFRYLHVRDAARLAVRAIEPDGEYDGHETVWAVASDTRVDVPTEDLLEAFYPDTEVRAPLSGSDGLFDVSKARDLVGWEPERSWRTL
jgi:nucleoside-diphosphate-sugar epimerase